MSVGAGFKNEMNKQLDSIAGGQIYLYLSDEGQKREEYMTEDDFAQIESKIDGVTRDFSGSLAQQVQLRQLKGDLRSILPERNAQQGNLQNGKW